MLNNFESVALIVRHSAGRSIEVALFSCIFPLGYTITHQPDRALNTFGGDVNTIAYHLPTGMMGKKSGKSEREPKKRWKKWKGTLEYGIAEPVCSS